MAKDEPKKYSDDDEIDYCLTQIKKIKEEQKTLNTDRADAMKFYRAEPEIVECAAGRSKATTTDLMDCVEWIKPSLLEVFASGDQFVSLDPGGEEDTVAVEKQNLLVNQQLKVKNNWFMILHDWFDDMLKLKTGAVKYQWFESTEFIDKDYTELTDDEYMAKEMEKDCEVLAHTENSVAQMVTGPMGLPMPTQVRTHNATIRKTVRDEYPLIEACPAEDIGYPLKTRDVKDAMFFYHRIPYEQWEIEKRYGKKILEKVKGLSEAMHEDTDEVHRERFSDLGGEHFITSKDDGRLWVYECYYKDKENGTPMVAEVCGDVKCSVGKNKYRKPPFHVITPIKMAHRVAGFSLYDLIKEIQKIRTALLRQIMDNVYFANNRRYFGDPNRMNVDDYLNNNFPGALVRTTGDYSPKPEEKSPIPQDVFAFWEMLNVEKDYHSGVPRSFQGVNPNVLNKTWRGQNQQIGQASQRVSMMIRLISEMGVAPLISDIVDLNIRFLKKPTMIRYMNTWNEITPDNIVGKYDVIVNVGLGTGNKDQMIIYMQQLLGLYLQAANAQIGVVTPINVYNAMKELIKAMGIRNVGDFVTEPKFTQTVMALLMTLQQMGAASNPQIGQMMQAIAGQLGMLPKPAGAGANDKGTAPGQEMPPTPETPQSPGEPRTQITGGGFFG
jgi:hypothetical protein